MYVASRNNDIQAFPMPLCCLSFDYLSIAQMVLLFCPVRNGPNHVWSWLPTANKFLTNDILTLRKDLPIDFGMISYPLNRIFVYDDDG